MKCLLLFFFKRGGGAVYVECLENFIQYVFIHNKSSFCFVGNKKGSAVRLVIHKLTKCCSLSDNFPGFLHHHGGGHFKSFYIDLFEKKIYVKI